MRKPYIIIGALILLVTISLFMGSFYEKYFSVPLRIKYKETLIYNEEVPLNFWRYGMKVRAGSFLALYDKTINEGHSPREALNFISEGLGDKLLTLADKKSTSPINAELVVKGEAPYFFYKKDIDGREVNQSLFAREIAKALDGGTAELVIERKTADVTVDMLRERTQLRASFSTNFATSTLERKSNIKLAMSIINGQVIEPGEEFSFNKVVGPRKAERGYKEAKIISNGKFIEGVGGGVCQVSTTLYNAALMSGLEIKNAIRHSLPVAYVPPSRDAMVSSANDFVFVNNTDFSLYIFTSCADNIAQIMLYGQGLSEKIKLETKVIKTIPFNNVSLSGQNICEEELACHKLIRAGKDGIVSELYMLSGNISRRIRVDRYSPQDAVWERIEISELTLVDAA
ncbi:MAG: hypothetical protein EOM87_01220 [Clostridia bacterium]|nr:hypothetical protein [Clostridia bacterium]